MPAGPSEVAKARAVVGGGATVAAPALGGRSDGRNDCGGPEAGRGASPSGRGGGGWFGEIPGGNKNNDPGAARGEATSAATMTAGATTTTGGVLPPPPPLADNGGAKGDGGANAAENWL